MICTIYDYETLGINPQTLPILSIALLKFDTDLFISQPYEYEDLVASAQEYKFNIEEQVKTYDRKIEMDTLTWWNDQDPTIRDRYLKPSEDDISISQLPSVINKECNGSKYVFTRGNTFDPIVTEALCRALGAMRPYDWRKDRDTRSYIEGMSYGSGMSNSFIPQGLESKFKAHDARHDIAMDVMRLQTIAQAIT